MSGRDAVRRLADLAAREEVVDVDIVARALTVSRRKLLRDWRRRQFGSFETRVGRSRFIPARLALHTYFPGHIEPLVPFGPSRTATQRAD